MSWRHRISLVLLIVLTALPVSGTVCAMLCDSAAATRAAAHHGSGKPCDGAELLLRQVRSFAAHPATTAATMMLPFVEAATTMATRADSVPGPSLLAAVTVHDTISNFADSDVYLRLPHSTWDGTPPTASPLVLRV